VKLRLPVSRANCVCRTNLRRETGVLNMEHIINGEIEGEKRIGVGIKLELE